MNSEVDAFHQHGGAGASGMAGSNDSRAGPATLKSTVLAKRLRDMLGPEEFEKGDEIEAHILMHDGRNFEWCPGVVVDRAGSGRHIEYQCYHKDWHEDKDGARRNKKVSAILLESNFTAKCRLFSSFAC